MAYHDDLLDQALDLVTRHPANQADLRRAISTAYYALFHLLVSETVAFWAHGRSRDDLARMMSHATMKRASDRMARPVSPNDPAVLQKLKRVARTFGLLQDSRHTADYDNAKQWPDAVAMDLVEAVEIAFADWAAIRTEPIAQDYLATLLITPR